MFEPAVESLSDHLSVLGDLIGIAADEISSQAKRIAADISASFANVKSIPQYGSQQELHHIVAKKAPNAEHARKILKAVGIGINSKHNLVYLKTGLHRRLHTNLYYGWANSVIISAYESANGDISKQYDNVITALYTIRTFLETLNTVAPFWEKHNEYRPLFKTI